MAEVEEESGGGSEEAVRVFVRIRPLNKRELAEKQTIGWNFNETSMLQDTQNGQRVYAFDRCFNPDQNNKEAYDYVGKPVVLKALEGFNGTVFTYGQTGSGKTFTMRGNDADPGMMILCIRDIFDYIANHPKRKFELRVSYMEVYNEEINDLLGVGPNSKNLRIVSEDAIKGAVIGGLIEELVANPKELMEVLHRGESNRSYGSTEMNAESSRSHTIYRLVIHSTEVDDGDSGADYDTGGMLYSQSGGGNASAGRLSFMNLVDLAGSERQKSTGATGKTLKEGSNINKSLLSLGAVISKLGEASKKPVKGAKPVFIPYRDSKLTRILKQSLGGNTLTSILCTVTPAPMHMEETVSTLKFGQLCKTIKNNVKNNEVVDDRALLKIYKNLVTELRAQLVEHESSRGRTASMISIGNGDDDFEDDDDNGGGNKKFKMEVTRLKKENEELKSTLAVAQQRAKEVEELEALKNSFDDYQKESQAAIDDERIKMDSEKENLQKERAKILAEKTHLDEKEGRLGTLLGMLDERESKLRQHLTALAEQQELWKQSANDLRAREVHVDEWNKSHILKQKKIDEENEKLNTRKCELDSRDVDVAEFELRLNNFQKELSDKESALATNSARMAEAEFNNNILHEKLAADEIALNSRIAVVELRERECADKRKELDVVNEVLKDRENKLSIDRRILDDKLDVAKQVEEQLRNRESELDKKATMIKSKEAEAVVMTERYGRMLSEVEARESQCQANANRQHDQEQLLSDRENRLNKLHDHLIVMETRLASVDAREEELQQRVENHAAVEEDFYNVKVALISARHAAELSELESLVAEQLKIAKNFQEEIERTRTELKEVLKEKSALETLNNARGLLIEKLQVEMAALNTDRKQLSAAEQSEGINASETDDDGKQVNNGGPNVSPEVSANTQVLLNQLGATQKMLFKILETHKHEKGTLSPSHNVQNRPRASISPRMSDVTNVETKSNSKKPQRRHTDVPKEKMDIGDDIDYEKIASIREKKSKKKSHHKHDHRKHRDTSSSSSNEEEDVSPNSILGNKHKELSEINEGSTNFGETNGYNKNLLDSRDKGPTSSRQLNVSTDYITSLPVNAAPNPFLQQPQFAMAQNDSLSSGFQHLSSPLATNYQSTELQNRLFSSLTRPHTENNDSSPYSPMNYGYPHRKDEFSNTHTTAVSALTDASVYSDNSGKNQMRRNIPSVVTSSSRDNLALNSAAKLNTRSPGSFNMNRDNSLLSPTHSAPAASVTPKRNSLPSGNIIQTALLSSQGNSSTQIPINSAGNSSTYRSSLHLSHNGSPPGVPVASVSLSLLHRNHTQNNNSPKNVVAATKREK